MTHTDDHTRLQLRTIVPRTADQFLVVTSGPFVTALEVSEHSRLRGEEVRTRIYLSAEQWAELSQVAAEMAAHPNTSKHDEDHWDNERVLTWQEKNREKKLAKAIRALIVHIELYGGLADYSYAESRFGEGAILALIDAGEIRMITRGNTRLLESVK